MKKYITNALKIIFISSLVSSLHAETGHSTRSKDSVKSSTKTSRSTGTLPSSSTSKETMDNSTHTKTQTDTISTGQSSTLSTNCISVKGQGKFCDQKAHTWCTTNSGAMECKNFKYDKMKKSNY